MSQNPKHQFAAILFADIVGYTALMQSDEQEALVKLQNFKLLLETKVASHDGKIIQFYGDGCLAIFDKSVDALNCAKALQIAFKKHPLVPVRIGLHEGEVVFKDDNVFGHAVNITSRVEAMGIAGAILMTGQVRKNLKNHKAFQLDFLGKFNLKNVADPISIYALGNEGFPVPNRADMKGLDLSDTKRHTHNSLLSWLLPLLLASSLGMYLLWSYQTPQIAEEILKERIAVLPFKNNTNDPNLESLGTMAADWINTGLMDIGEAEVVSPFTVRTHLNAIAVLEDDAKNRPSFAQLTGAKNLITGNYYKDQGSIIFKLELVDAQSGNLRFSFDEVIENENNREALINKLRAQVTGYWAARELIDAKKITTPNLEAYELYLETIQKRGTEKDLSKILVLDSTFYLARIHFLNLNYGGRLGKNKPHFHFLERHASNLSEYEMSWFTYLKGIYLGNPKAAFNSLNNIRIKYPKDFLLNHSTANVALEGLSNPELALEIYKELPMETSQANAAGVYWNFRLLNMVICYIQLNQLADATIFLDHILDHKPTIDERYLKAILYEALASGNKEKIDRAYQQLNDSFKSNPFDYFLVHLELIQSNLLSPEFRKQHEADMVLRYNQLPVANKILWTNIVAKAKNDISAIDLSILDHLPASFKIGHLVAAGQVYAEAKQISKVQEIISALEELTTCDYSGQNQATCAVAYYFMGLLQTQIGEKEKAIANLKTAKDLGLGDRLYRFQYSKFIEPLFDLPAFKELLQPIWPEADQAKVAVVELKQYFAATEKLENITNDFKQNQVIQLASGDRFFNLKLGITNNYNKRGLVYQYRLKDVEQEWSIADKGEVTISGLPYGQQTLLIRAQFPNGRFTREILKIPVFISKPFFLRPWFLLATLGSILLGIWLWTQRLKKQKKQLEQEVLKRTTQIKKQAEELRQLDKVKSNFFANVSHELRTPLTLILSPLDRLLKSDNIDAREFGLLKIMQQNGQNLYKLVDEIMDLTKLEAGKLSLQETSVQLYPFLLRLVNAFNSHAEKKGIKLALIFQANKQLHITLDKDKFEKILNNLLSNALKFTPEGGSVTILLEDLGPTMQLEVHDTGRGIHPDDLAHIFNRFYQTKQPGAASEGGTGIGLALVQELAKLFGGSVSAESQVGIGSQFFFSFPKRQAVQAIEKAPYTEIVEENQADILSPQEALSANATLENKIAATSLVVEKTTAQLPQILVIEDNAQLREYIELILSDQYQVRTAANGKEALDWLNQLAPAKSMPDLIVSDLMMPVLDGFQLLSILKGTKKFRTIPIIMLTARADLQDKLTALRIGVDDYMIKPFVEEELLARVANLLSNSKARLQFLQTEIVDSVAPTSIESSATINDAPTTPTISQEDLDWLTELEKQVLAAMGSYDLTLETLSQTIFLSPRQIRRRLKQLTGLSFSQYLKEARFRKARQLLELNKVRSIKQLAYEVGMRDVKYFSQQFKRHFGKNPSAYLNL